MLQHHGTLYICLLWVKCRFDFFVDYKGFTLLAIFAHIKTLELVQVTRDGHFEIMLAHW